MPLIRCCCEWKIVNDTVVQYSKRSYILPIATAPKPIRNLFRPVRGKHPILSKLAKESCSWKQKKSVLKGGM